MEDLITQLITLMQDVAPELWAIAQRQVLAETVEMGIFLVAFVLLLVVSLKIAKKYPYKEDVNEGYLSASIGSHLSVVATAVAIFLFASGLIRLVISPDYKAIQVLMNLVKQ